MLRETGDLVGRLWELKMTFESTLKSIQKHFVISCLHFRDKQSVLLTLTLLSSLSLGISKLRLSKVKTNKWQDQNAKPDTAPPLKLTLPTMPHRLTIQVGPRIAYFDS